MIVDSNYIIASLIGLIEEVKSKVETYLVPSKKYYINQDLRTAHWVGRSLLK